MKPATVAIHAQRLLASLILAAFAIPVATAAAASAAPRPNILVILADDMGYSDVGCYGSEIRTPNIDSLAARGIRFSQFYTTPKCFPSRASFLTGLYPHQAGMGRKPATFTNCTTVAEVLRSAGYHTWMVGKWHGKDVPVTRGFEHYFGLNDGESNHFNPGHQRPGEPVPAADKGDRHWAIDDKVYFPYTPPDPKFYSTDTFTDYALRYLDEQKDDKPFFLYVAYTAPHYPIQAWPEDIAKYRGKYRSGWDAVRVARHERQVQMGLLPVDVPMAPRGNTKLAVVRETGPWMTRFWDNDGNILPWEKVADHDRWDEKMAVYAAMVDRMDQNVGRLLAKLRELKKDSNTLIVFLSDNGACSGTHHYGATPKDPPPSGPGPVDSFHTYDSPWADVSVAPFYGYKDTCYEGGLATPAVIAWADGLKSGRGTILPDVAHIMDLMPTFLELAGATYPATFAGKPIPPMEGRSLVPLLDGKPWAGHPELFWEYNGDRAVRRGDWKIVSLPDEPWELYDLSRDRAEQHNLAAARPDLVRDLGNDWNAWAHKVGADKLPPKKKASGD